MAGTEDLRLVALEENSYFQEKRLNDLDAALRAQQSQLDKLTKLLDGLGRQLAVLRECVDGLHPANVPPPHYTQEK